MKSTITLSLIVATMLSSAAYASSPVKSKAAPAAAPTTAATQGTSSFASDNGFFFKPYVGADYEYSNVNYSSGNGGIFARSLNGGDVHVGARVHKYLGFEASYFDTAKSDKNNVLGLGINTTVKLQGEAFDVMGYIPVAPKLELIGTVGVAHTQAKGTASAVGAITVSASENKGRFGGGAQYWIDDNLNVRGLLRYQDADFKNTTNGVTMLIRLVDKLEI